jgi:hypothetical protein
MSVTSTIAPDTLVQPRIKVGFINVHVQHWLYAIVVFMAGFALSYALLTATPALLGTDDYYHTRIAAQIIEQRRLALNFPWLPLTILSPQQFVDHHLLYHLYLAPWAYYGGVTGVKLAQAGVMAALVVTLWSLLRFLNVRFATLWTVALFGVSVPFLYRILMIRTQGAAVLLMLIALDVLFRHRYRWLIVVAFAFTWLYNGFVLLPAFAGLYLLAAWITDRKFVWQPLAYVVIGVALGLIINPYFPQNIAFIIDHLGEKVDIASSVRLGSEWYPYTTEAIMTNSTGALLVLILGFCAASFSAHKRDRVETTLLFIVLLMLYMVFKSRRFIEYFPAFALLYGAVALGRGQVRLLDYLPSFLTNIRFVRSLMALLVLLPAAYLVWTTSRSTYSDIQQADELAYFEGASQWLQQHTEPGEMIFQTDWDDFTRLFYYNTHNTYLVGLDPTYLQVADPLLWNLWVAITRGQVDLPSSIIQESFGANYVVSDVNHPEFASRADADPHMQLVYRDAYSLIWHVTLVPLEPGT